MTYARPARITMNKSAKPQIIKADSKGLWFLGTYAKIKFEANHTAGRLGMFEDMLPRGAAPPLHSHSQDETFYILDGQVTVWIVEDKSLIDQGPVPSPWVKQCAVLCNRGDSAYAPGGMSHSFRVESDSARMLVISTPAGIEDYVREASQPAQWSWLPVPADGPRIA